MSHSRHIPVHLEAHKGRGAVANMQGRYERDVREVFDDGWVQHEAEHEQAEPLKTSITIEHAKSILNRNDSPDLPFRQSLNPYRGCEHGCIYCFVRPTHSYLGLSPGLDFESRLFAKVNAAELLRRELAAPNYQPEAIALGINTDAYQPIERELNITRQCIEVLHETRHPFALLTKSSLIERDVDLLTDLARAHLVRAAVTITTLDHEISRKLEPRAASPARRLRVIRTLADAGIPMGVSVSPIIPFITDGEMERILEQAAEAGATRAHFTVLRLPWELKDVFQQWLRTHFPQRAERVMNRIHDLRGGKDYDSHFGQRMTGEGIWAALFQQRFQKACRRVGINPCAEPGFDLSLFRKPFLVPVKPKPGSSQLDLFA